MKVIIGRIRISGNQKRINVPKQIETQEWEEGDFIKLEKAVIQ